MTRPEVARIGAQLRRKRTSSGLSLTHVANSAGCAKSMLSHVERGQREPSLSLLIDLCKVLRLRLQLQP